MKDRRSSISPNFNFLGQLYEYEKHQLTAFAQQSQSNKNNQETKNTNDSSTPTTSTTTTASTSTKTSSSESGQTIQPPFLKFARRPASTMSYTSMHHQTNPTIHVSQSFIFGDFNYNNSSSNASLSSTKTSNKQQQQQQQQQLHLNNKNDLLQKKKQFIFEFNASNNSNNANSNSNILIQSPCSSIKSLQIHSPNYSLHSPSKAFSNFHINSPTANTTASKPYYPISQLVSSVEPPKPPLSLTLSKSYTMDSFSYNSSGSTSSTGGAVVRRPTNLLLANSNPVTKVPNLNAITEKLSNKLKRPSSILFSSSNINDAVQIEDKTTSTITSASAGTNKEDNLFVRSLSNNSAGSSGSSSCSCSSLSTNSSNICGNCSTNSTCLTQKKLKLSPIQDKLVSFSKPSIVAKSSPTTTISVNIANTNELTTSEFFKQSLFDQNLNQGSNAQQQHQMVMNTNNVNKTAGTPLTPTSILNADNLISCFNQKLNESKSIENIKMSLGGSNATNYCCFKDEMDTENIENNGAGRGSNPKISNSVSLNSINMIPNSNNNASGGNNQGGVSGVSGGKTGSGSNKNSLHGSIETMIEVS